jgi:acetyl-CoA carboxylase biotin carboxyl carrier protein
MPIVKSEVAGSVWMIEVEVGRDVVEGEVLMILECMKMEIPVEASASGRVAEIFVAKGAAIAEDQPLLRLEAP